ncbi:hypothetical protein PCYB_141010 [Plasmodium cynomolgi strain B]|uniref:RAD protein n=1 Tax=Plasmodium cynomolgi (strain B) TaxID=1120755 RepID=K6UXY9_PLACD|nr:hypothetical protein PCYB_141010 [Plasmodium cynomolgi strain B]GAB68674.1 hypothetical protein PCYB_141010 [Plasmodium cynomolgi strain B]
MNSITLLLHVIALTFLFWQSDSLCDMRGPIKRSPNRQHISGGKLGSSFGRILHEADEISTESFRNSNIPYVRLIDYSDSHVYYVQFEEADAGEILQSEFADKLSRQWYEAITEMASEYVEFTELMNVQWRDKMWTDIWVKYLSSISHDLQIYLSYTFLPINCREEIFNNLVHLTRKDFKAFLNIIDDKWNEKLNNNDV